MLLDLGHTQKLLDQYQPFDATDAQYKMQFTDFIASVDLTVGRNADGVLTAAGWIVDPVVKKVLLIRNHKLQLWLNPGGKYEPEDGSLLRTMQREVMQESGISAALDAPLFDISYIRLDYNRYLKHPMFDFRFLVKADSTVPLQPQETDKMPTWFSLADLKERMPDDIQNYRLLRRTETLFGA